MNDGGGTVATKELSDGEGTVCDSEGAVVTALLPHGIGTSTSSQRHYYLIATPLLPHRNATG